MWHCRFVFKVVLAKYKYCHVPAKTLISSEQTAARADALARGDADPEAGAGPGLGVPPPPGDHGRLRAIPLQDAGGVARPGNNNINYYSGYY